MAKENRRGIAVLAVLTVVVMSGCSARKTASSNGNSDIPDTLLTADDASSSDSLASNDVNSIVTGAFDDTNVATSQNPSNIGTASSQQSYCSAASANSQGQNFFTSLVSQGGISGAADSACFTGGVNTSQLMYANYVQIAVLTLCQDIALRQLAQTPNTPEALNALFQQATEFILQCAANSVGIEGAFGYSQYMASAASNRVTALLAGARLLSGNLRR